MLPHPAHLTGVTQNCTSFLNPSILHDGNEFNFVFVQDTTERKKIENALRQKEGYQRALLDNFPFMVWLKDKQSNYLVVNQVLAKALGEQDPSKMVGKSDFDYSPKEIAEGYQRDDRLVLASNQRKTLEEALIDHLGVRRWLETFKAPVVDENGEQLGTVGFARDITERKKIEEELRIAAIAFESQEGMIITDANAIILKINQAFTKMTGFTAEEAVGYKMNLLKSGKHDASFYAEMWESIKQRGSWQGEIWNRRKNGNIYPEWLTITAVTDGGGDVTHYVGTMIDITVRKTVEEQMHHLAHHDVLTNLPNRTLLADRLHQALAQARREKGMLALMFLDLDKFKPVNDELGHDVGDLLLKEVATRLQNCVKRESDTVSRLGGDEFVILLPLIEEEHDAAVVAEKALQALSQPFEIEQHTINISCSIGIAVYPEHGKDAHALMINADNAMYKAKQAGRSCFSFFNT
jgi:diguanylate cyclase (GGDEF)-like protein/PAS domain S-box-containing protein